MFHVYDLNSLVAGLPSLYSSLCSDDQRPFEYKKATIYFHFFFVINVVLLHSAIDLVYEPMLSAKHMSDVSSLNLSCKETD